MLTERKIQIHSPAASPVERFARELLEAMEPRRDGRTNGNGRSRENDALQAEITRAQARRVATRVGRGMLVATSVETARHSDDVVVIARAMCDLLEIRGPERQDLLAAAILHDIGKAAVPRHVLEKPGPLNEDEWALMRSHTMIGEEILARVPELREIARIVRHSHERWDGRGYPDGLAGEEIPFASRVVFCADSFDAIRCDRPYRAGRNADAALEEVRRHSGTQFDPRVVAALVQVAGDLRRPPSGPFRVRRSSRLTALLLVLTLGASGSAIARSGLLGEPTDYGSGDLAAVAPAACGALDCPPLLGLTLADQIQAARSGEAKAKRSEGASGSKRGGASGKRGNRSGADPGRGGGELSIGIDQIGRASIPGVDKGAGRSPSASEPGEPVGDSGRPHPLGGPPGQTGNTPPPHPLGGPRGQTGTTPPRS